MSEEQTAELVGRAAAGDADAWRALVDRYRGVVWAVARAHRLPDADAADVSQATWLSLAQHLHRLRDPDRVAAWLTTTARRESLRVLAVRRREPPVDLSTMELAVDGPEAGGDAVWRALRGLPERCRALLRLIAYTPDLSYAQAARALGIPAASVGQTRGRCLAVLRRRLERW
ncbi:MAG TPA: sigma-70 family RNA polymerase sigma factor [Pseudonocardiaceae bacterium]|nr:sigma-70 family RNA polymerase sigma factor [Pseudonocardiaceae bacterium]